MHLNRKMKRIKKLASSELVFFYFSLLKRVRNFLVFFFGVQWKTIKQTNNLDNSLFDTEKHVIMDLVNFASAPFISVCIIVRARCLM